MLEKKTYLGLKRDIKSLCRKNVVTMCDDMELNDEERNLLMYFYDGKSKVQTCMDLCIGSTTYSVHMRLLFEKIYNYKKTL